MNGKTIFLWNIRDVYSGDPERIAQRAVELGFSAVLIKVADGKYNHNLHPVLKTDTYVEPVVNALRRNGVQVIPWGYVYGVEPKAEAERAAERVRKFGFATWLVNAELQFKAKGMGETARVYMKRLRELQPNITIGLTSYRYPSIHPEFCWAYWAVDYYVPQVYWAGSHNPAGQLERSYSEYQALSKKLWGKILPYYPAGAAYHEHGWQPTAAEIIEFHDKVVSMGFGAESFWEWGHAIRYGFESTIGSLNFSSPPPQEQALAEKLKEIEKRLETIEKALDITKG